MEEEKKTLAEMSTDTRFILQRLQKAEEEEVVTYEELSTIIGRDVTKKARPNLQSAMRAALRDRMVFECVRKIGVKRLKNSQIPDVVSTNTITRIRHQARKGVRKLGCTDVSKLTRSEQLRMYASMSMLGTIASVATEKKVQALEKVCVGGELPLAKTLEAFKEA